MKKTTRNIIAGFMAIAMATTFAACGKNTDDPTPADGSTGVTEDVKLVNPITNSTDFSESSKGKRPLAVVINNQPQARPQWGLNSADAVFEFPVEGMITRMLWLFSDYTKLPEKIGPIRSARHHFVYTAGSLDSIYIHWGGSSMGYQAIEDEGIDDIDQLDSAHAPYFYRDKTRDVAIEHRGITDGGKLQEAVDKFIDRKELEKNSVAPFFFANEEVVLNSPCSKISYTYGGKFNRAFTYDASDGLYYNSMNGTAFKDGNTDEQNAVKNVFVLYAPTKELANGLVDVDLTSGEGVYAANGKSAKINWTKGNDAQSHYKFTYEDGSDVKLETGKSWISVVQTSQARKTVIE